MTTQPTQDPKQGTVMTQIDEPNLDEQIRELISFAIMDGQNQIHDLKDGTATPEEVTERMFKSLDYFTEKAKALIATQIQEARLDELEHLLKDYDIEASRATEILLNDRLAQLRSNQ